MRTITFLLIVTIFTSCTPTLYFPEKVVTTGFTEKNQSFINASVKPQSRGADSTNRPGNTFSIAASGGYSFAKNLGAYVAYSNVSERTVKEFYQPSIIGGKSITGGIFNGSRYELGLVYFKKSGKHDIFECSGGYSFGDMIRTSDVRPQRNFDTKYYTVFIQPSWGVKLDNFIFNGGMKFWYQRFTEFNASPATATYFNSPQRTFTQLPYFFMCPFVNLEGGMRFVKFNTQLGFPIHYRNQKNDVVLYGFPLYLTFGLTFRLEKDIFSDIKSLSVK